MNIQDLQIRNVLSRPLVNLKEIPDGAYKGFTKHAGFEEKDDKFNGGIRVVLNLKVEVSNNEGELVDLYTCANYSWSSKGNMIKLLEKLNCLPKPGEEISLDDLVDIPVQVIVENVEKDGERYPNIISIKRISDYKVSAKMQSAQKPSKNDKRVLKQEMEQNINELEQDMEADEDEFQFDDDDDDEDDDEDFEENDDENDDDDDSGFDLADLE